MKKQILVLLTAVAFSAQGQDSLNKASKIPKRRHEVGISVIVPIIIAFGASDNSERYTNLTYRYFLNKKHVVKPFVGVSSIVNTVSDLNGGSEKISASATSTIYAMTRKTNPSNVQLGVGYEYVMGDKKLKHAIGADIYYNNKFEKEERSYYREVDTTDVNGSITRESARIDTGRYVTTKNYDKIGLNISYTLRYEASKRWVITLSTIMTNKFYWDKSPRGRSSVYDMNFIGLVSDVSIFYRF